MAAIAVGVVALRVTARRHLFPVAEVAPAEPPGGFVEQALVARDGTPVRLLELPARVGERTIVHFHNNRETVEHQAALGRALSDRGFGVVLVEYRGYGRSIGEPSETGLYLDAHAALDMLEMRGVTTEEVVLLGVSLGTGVAAEMARLGRAGRLVLVTPYTSIPDVVTAAVPLVPASVLVPDHFDTLSKASGIRIPTLVIHGTRDEIVPFSMGARLSDALPDARLRAVPGGRHGDLFAVAGRDLLDEIGAFARR